MLLRRFPLLLILLLVFQQPGSPCAPAPPAGASVTILDESAWIIWDSERKIEHFIRHATFQSDAADFGFLVPTPEKPELAELPNAVFDVGHLMAPETVYHKETGIRLVIGLVELFIIRSSVDTAAPMSGVPRSVRVIEETQVAGYDAAVLEADDAEALSAWLTEHGYPSSPELQQWFEPYVAMKWKITAFKISGDQTTRRVATSAVRMSFHTDQPFFPYREPKMETGNQSRLLQILMLSQKKMEGKLGADFTEAWPGKTTWANRLKAGDATSLVDRLKITIDPEALWLIYFEDSSSPRPGHSDLYFRAASDQVPVVPPPMVVTRDARIPIPVDLLLAIALLGIFVYKRRRHAPGKVPKA